MAAQFRREPQIRVLAVASRGCRAQARYAREMAAEEIREREIPSRVPPLVVESRPSGGEERAAALDEALDGRRLRIGEGADVGQDEELQGRTFGIDVVRLDGEIRNSRPHERVHEARVGRIHDITGIVTAEEVGVALRPDDADVGDGRAIDEIGLMSLPPSHHRLRGAEHPLIFLVGADVMPPWLDAAGDARDHPHPRLGRRLARHAVITRARLVHRHGFGRELVPPEKRVDALAGVPVLLKPRVVVSPLVVEHHDVGAGADFLEIAERARLRGHRAAVHAGPDAVRSAGGSRDAVVQLPHFGPPCVAPHDPFPIHQVVPVGLPRQRLAGLRLELPRTTGAVTDALAPESRPAVVGESVRVRALDDLAKHARQVLVVVGAVDARDVLIGRAIGPAVRVAREPVGMGGEEILARAVRIHPGHHEQSILMRGLRQVAKEVATAEELRAVLQREPAWVVGDDAPGVDDQGLDLGALPVTAPPGDVVALGVLFGDVRLAPEIRAPVPRHARRDGLRSRRGAGQGGASTEDDRGRQRVAQEDAAGHAAFAVGHGRHCTIFRLKAEATTRQADAGSYDAAS